MLIITWSEASYVQSFVFPTFSLMGFFFPFSVRSVSETDSLQKKNVGFIYILSPLGRITLEKEVAQ